MATIVLVAALDTKGEEAQLVRDYVASRTSHRVVAVNTGVMGEPIAAMAQGAAAVAARLRQEGRLDGIVGLGGSAGTAVGSAAMRALPVGVPKVLVSTVASGNVAPYVGTKDITLMYSVVDVAGINRLSRAVLTNAAGAICGAVEAAQQLAAQPAGEEQPLLAASMFGNTTNLVDAARAVFEGHGYDRGTGRAVLPSGGAVWSPHARRRQLTQSAGEDRAGEARYPIQVVVVEDHGHAIP